jgi:hypothetical protein
VHGRVVSHARLEVRDHALCENGQLATFFADVRRDGTLDVLEVLPFGDPVAGLAAVVAFFEDGEALAEVLGVDVGEDLPQELAVFELAP